MNSIAERTSKNYCTLYIVRHGQTTWNTQRKIQGHLDSPLTEEGKAQARRLAQRLGSEKIDVVFSSDLGRAVQTAEILAIEKELAVVTTELLRERYLGEYQGKTIEVFEAELRELLAEKNRLSVAQQATFEVGHGIETDEKMMARVFTQLREVAAAYAGKNAILVSHSGVMRTLLMHLGMAEKFADVSHLANSAYIKLRSDGTDFFVDELHGITFAKDSPGV